MDSKFWRQSKKLLLMGETKDKIAKTAEKLGFTDYEFVESLQEAVSRGAELASEGDAVLLSPACASWDMFDCTSREELCLKSMFEIYKGSQEGLL